MQRSSFTTGNFGESGFPATDGTIRMAPEGQWRAQLPHSTPSVFTMQFSAWNTAWPICTEDLSGTVMGRIAPVGHTSEHRTHSGRQYPRSYDISGCIHVPKAEEGRNTPFGHADTQSWQAVQCAVK